MSARCSTRRAAGSRIGGKPRSRSHRKRGVPVPVLMATLRKESGFQHNAKPPRGLLLGFIPWKRVSSAYGYSQALDGTWAQYQKETGNTSAKRNNFADAVDFVGWYHSKTADLYGIAKDDTYNLYLAYYFGWTGYESGAWKEKPGLQDYAPRDRADGAQLRQTAQQMRPGCIGCLPGRRHTIPSSSPLPRSPLR